MSESKRGGGNGEARGGAGSGTAAERSRNARRKLKGAMIAAKAAYSWYNKPPGWDDSSSEDSDASSTVHIAEDAEETLEQMREKQKAVSWTTHTLGGQLKENALTPGPGTYKGYDPKAIGEGEGVPFAGKGIKRELTAVDLSYKALLATPAPGQYDTAKPAIQDKGVPLVTSKRFEDQRTTYMGSEYALKGQLGPGLYTTSYSSFRMPNPNGPPHSFGATNHETKYDTDSPGPAAYAASKKAGYSPHFGFGASKRGEGNKVYAGNEFMVKGRDGPGPGASGKGHGDLNVSGGVLSTTKRPANDPLPKKESWVHPDAKKLKEMKDAKREKLTKEKIMAQAKAKDYSWLHDDGARPVSRHMYLPSRDGPDMRPTKNFKSAPSAGFGAGPRFDEAQFIPSVRTSRTPGPGPAYRPKWATVGEGPKMPFTTERKLKMTPDDFSRRHNPGPGHYNLTAEQKAEEMAILAAKGEELEAEGAELLQESGLLELDEELLGTIVDTFPMDEFIGKVGEKVGWNEATRGAVLRKLAAAAITAPGDFCEAARSGKLNKLMLRHGFKRFSKKTVTAAMQVYRDMIGSSMFVVEEEDDSDEDADDEGDGERRSPQLRGGAGGSTTDSQTDSTMMKKSRAAPPRSPTVDRLRSMTRSAGSASGLAKQFASTVSLRKEASQKLLGRSLSSMSLLVEKRGGTPPPMGALRRGESTRSMTTPDGAPSPQVISPDSFRKFKSSKRMIKTAESFKSITKFADGKHTPSVHMAMGDRDTFERKMYHGGGSGTGIKGVTGPGPGIYKIGSSSFRKPNPHGPPHQFGATNHDQSYDTPGPGPAAYNAVPPKSKSPQFGFGASMRGGGDRSYWGNEVYMQHNKGTLGPALVKVHSDMAVSGGKFSSSKRPVAEPLPKPPPNPFEEMAMAARKKKEKSARRKAEARRARQAQKSGAPVPSPIKRSRK